MVGLLQVALLQQGMGMGMLRHQHDAESIPVQPGHGMESALLAGTAVIARHQIGQGAVVLSPGGWTVKAGVLQSMGSPRVGHD